MFQDLMIVPSRGAWELHALFRRNGAITGTQRLDRGSFRKMQRACLDYLAFGNVLEKTLGEVPWGKVERDDVGQAFAMGVLAACLRASV